MATELLKEYVQVRLDKELKDALFKAAYEKRTSGSQYARQALVTALKADGYLGERK